MTSSDGEAARWKEVGRMLGHARQRLLLSKRAAAQKAGFSEITWRQLEAGERQLSPGVMVPVSPRDDTLHAAAQAVGISTAALFAAAGRPWNGPSEEVDTAEQMPAALSGVWARLDEKERARLVRIAEQLVNDG